MKVECRGEEWQVVSGQCAPGKGLPRRRLVRSSRCGGSSYGAWDGVTTAGLSRRSLCSEGGKENRKNRKNRKIGFCPFFNWNLLPLNLFQPQWETSILRIL